MISGLTILHISIAILFIVLVDVLIANLSERYKE